MTNGTLSEERLRAISLVILDVDGVLTDGSVWVDEEGHEFKRFSVLDGYGISLLREAGLEVAIVTRENRGPALARAQKLQIASIYTGCLHKGEAVEHLLSILGVSREAALFVGDDLPDLEAFAQVGNRVAVRDAVPEVKAEAHYITRRRGGNGAVREVADLILAARRKCSS